MFWVYDFVNGKFQSFFNSIRNKDGETKSIPASILVPCLKNTMRDYEMKSSTIIRDQEKDLIVISIGDKNIQMKPHRMMK